MHCLSRCLLAGASGFSGKSQQRQPVSYGRSDTTRGKLPRQASFTPTSPFVVVTVAEKRLITSNKIALRLLTILCNLRRKRTTIFSLSLSLSFSSRCQQRSAQIRRVSFFRFYPEDMSVRNEPTAFVHKRQRQFIASQGFFVTFANHSAREATFPNF